MPRRGDRQRRAYHTDRGWRGTGRPAEPTQSQPSVAVREALRGGNFKMAQCRRTAKWCRPLLAACAPSVRGCAGHNVYLVGRTTCLPAQSKFRIVHPARDVSFTVGNEVYPGRWIYMEGGGSIGPGTATTSSGAHSVTTAGTVIGLPIGGNGTFIGSSPSGAMLRCAFDFSERKLEDLRVCHDSKRETYDLQIE